jgi:ABC-type antimicrobial peptide transport system permease subunit
MGSNESPAPVRRTVVGVVKDVRQFYADEDLTDLYVPLLQSPGRFASLFARGAGPPASQLPALRQALKEIDREVALDSPRPLPAFIDDQLASPRFLASLLSGFALFAALLALLGVYGVIAYAVRQREREIAVRMALGADPRTVLHLFLRQGAVVIAIGIGAGILGARAMARTLESQLHGVRAADPLTLIAVSFVFAAAGLVAAWWPARRAARTDPASALREE